MSRSKQWAALLVLAASLIATSAWAVEVNTGGVGVLGGLSRENTSAPGQSYQGVIVVTNQGAQPAEVKVYQTDYTPLRGGCKYGEPGTTPRSNAKWITLTPQQLVIPPGEKGEVFYTVTVPQDPELKGSYWSMVMVEPMKPISVEPPKVEKDQIAVGIVSVVRYGLLMLTHIGGTGTRELRILERELQEAQGKRTLLLHVENTGERVLSCKVWAELYNAEGMSVGRFGREGSTSFFPGSTQDVRIDLSGVPAGAYNALVVIDAGGEDVFGAQYDLNLTEPGEE